MSLIPIAGLVITVVVVVGAFFTIFRVFGRLAGGEAARRRLLQIGRPAHARVLQVQMGSMTVTTGVNRQLELHLQLEVHFPGAAPYVAQLTSLVSELQIPQVQPGSWLGVRVDPANPHAMAIEATGLPPPAFPGAAATPGQAAPPGGFGAGPSPYPAGYGAAAPPAGQWPGAPGGGFGAAAGAFGAPGYGAAQPAVGFGGVPMAPWPAAAGAPVGGFRLPLGAKIGLAIGLVGAVVGIGAAVMAVGWTSGIGGPSEVCEKVAACCRKLAGRSPAASNCDNYLKQSGPIANEVCEQTLEAYRKSGSCK
ncbi:MAG: hypothetical protein HY744_07075 [Deltaproteobacteria bacterium]|nr:hypothetical protein [Deltaproteobacteria bacterium]